MPENEKTESQDTKEKPEAKKENPQSIHEGQTHIKISRQRSKSETSVTRARRLSDLSPRFIREENITPEVQRSISGKLYQQSRPKGPLAKPAMRGDDSPECDSSVASTDSTPEMTNESGDDVSTRMNNGAFFPGFTMGLMMNQTDLSDALDDSTDSKAKRRESCRLF